MSSMFGQLNPASSSQSQTAPAINIFGHLTSSQSQQSPTSQPGGLFGSLASSQAPAPQSTGTPLQQSSVFAELSGQLKPPASANVSDSQASTLATGSGGGILGSSQLAGAQPPHNTSFPDSQNNATTSQPFGSSFISPQQSQQQQTQSGQSQGWTGQPSLGISRSSQPVYFDNLLEKGRNKANDHPGGSGFGELPSLQLGLGDIARRAREIGGAGGQVHGGATVDGKAHYLLAASGVNPGTTRRDLNALNAIPFVGGNQQQLPEWDPDTGKYVAQLQQQSTLKMTAEGVERAHRNFDAFLEENVDINWELQRKKIYEHFGLLSKGNDVTDEGASFGSPGGKGSFGRSTRKGQTTNTRKPGQASLNRSIFGKSSLQKSVIGTPGVGSPNATLFADVTEKNGNSTKAHDDRLVRERQAKFAEVVQKLNQARLDEKSYPVVQEFASVERQSGGESSKRLIDAYEALTEIVDDPNTSKKLNGSILAKERHFAESYLDETPNFARSTNIRKKIINGSRSCLEKQFFDHLTSIIARHPREANVGGIPTNINKVRAYVRIRAGRKDLTPDGTDLQVLENDYCWALIFFCLRAGLLREAAEYVTSNATAFRALDRNFITYITSYAGSTEKRLSRSMQDRINAEYQQRSRIAPENSLDPYRMACYKVIGRCELSKRTLDTISQGIEDWIWLQFSLAREVNRAEEVAGDVFGLEEVRETIREIGQRYFIKGQEDMGGYGTYFFLQVLGGMFEQAIAFLYPYSYVSAVHFAIALDFYGLLRVSDFSISESELLTYNTKEMPQISFGRMLGYYTRDFRSGNVEAAVDYLALICLNGDLPGSLGKSQASLCHEALRELVLETREFAQLLGDIRSDGTRLRGAIEQRLKLISLADQDEFLHAVTIQAASIADDNGRTSDAVLLYHLAEDYDNVITIINRALSEAIAIEIGQEEMRLQPLKPRTSASPTSSYQQQQEPPPQEPPPQEPSPGSSLSLTSVDDPVVLARNMISLYNANALYYQKILPANRDACGILLRLSEVKSKVLVGKWAEALDLIDALNLLPLHAKSSIPAIRSHAQAFNALPATISRNIGPLLLWSITCIGRQRDILATGQYGVDGGNGNGTGVGGAGGTRQEMDEELLVGAKDLMVFAGLVKYRLGERVWEAVTKCGGDVGVYS